MKNIFSIVLFLMLVLTLGSRPLQAQMGPIPIQGFTWVTASLTDLEEAKQAAKNLYSAKAPSFVVKTEINGNTRYRICVGRFGTRAQARSFRFRLQLQKDETLLSQDSWVAELDSDSQSLVFVATENSGDPIIANSSQPADEEITNPAEVLGSVENPLAQDSTALAPGAEENAVALVILDEQESSELESPEIQDASFLSRHFGIQLQLMSGYDTNIDHNQIYDQSSGLVPGLRLDFRSSRESPWLEMSYVVGQHTWFQADRWNRTSHLFRTQLRPRLSGPIRMKTTSELSLKGTTEDRDLSDQIQIGHEFEFRFTRYQRLHLTGMYRRKTFEDSTRNAIKPYVELSHEQRFRNDRRWETAIRYEFNDADQTRRDYKRWTMILGYELPLGQSTDLEFEVKHRRKLYEDRDVEIEEEDYLRRDFRWNFNASLTQYLSRGLSLEFNYLYELNDSLDPEKEWKAHLGRMILLYKL